MESLQNFPLAIVFPGNRGVATALCTEIVRDARNRVDIAIATIGVEDRAKVPNAQGLTHAQAWDHFLGLAEATASQILDTEKRGRASTDSFGRELPNMQGVGKLAAAIAGIESFYSYSAMFKGFREAQGGYATVEGMQQLLAMTLRVVTASADPNPAKVLRVLHYDAETFAFFAIASGLGLDGKPLPDRVELARQQGWFDTRKTSKQKNIQEGTRCSPSFPVREVSAPYCRYDITTESLVRHFYALQVATNAARLQKISRHSIGSGVLENGLANGLSRVLSNMSEVGNV